MNMPNFAACHHCIRCSRLATIAGGSPAGGWAGSVSCGVGVAGVVCPRMAAADRSEAPAPLSQARREMFVFSMVGPLHCLSFRSGDEPVRLARRSPIQTEKEEINRA